MLKKFTAIVLLAVIIGISYALFVMFSAKNNAIKLSSNEPFCVQVAAARDYKEVENIFDLAGFRMYGGNVKNHAVLVVGTISNYRLYHWSYWADRFVEGAYGPPPIYCNPRIDFFKSKNVENNNSENNINLVFQGYMFSIPKIYNPRTIWPDDYPGMMLTARAPTFAPTNGELCTGRLCNMVEIRFGILPRLEIWRNITDNKHSVENQREFFGLTKQRVLSEGSKYSSIQYYKLDDTGKVKTIIMCAEEDDVQCLHSFYENGISFSFHEMPNDLSNWQTTESTLAGLFDSFRNPVQ